MEALFQQPNALPSAPKLVQDLISSFNDNNISTEDLVRKLSADPVLSAKLLRLANSAYYQASRNVSTVKEAVMMLGFVTIRTLVISSTLINGFKSGAGLDLKKFWRYCLHTSVVAKWLAQKVNHDSELVFTAAVMHAIGQLVIHVGVPEQAMLLDKAVDPLDSSRFDAERNSLGYDYAEVGAELASRWKFPEVFSDAILAFPNPLEQQPFNSVGAIIHLAVWFAQANEKNLSSEEIRSNCPTDVFSKLNLLPEVLLEHMPPMSELTNGLEELFA
jgi:HD-like signal output (HDOD) protein